MSKAQQSQIKKVKIQREMQKKLLNLSTQMWSLHPSKINCYEKKLSYLRSICDEKVFQKVYIANHVLKCDTIKLQLKGSL